MTPQQDAGCLHGEQRNLLILFSIPKSSIDKKCLFSRLRLTDLYNFSTYNKAD